MLERTIRGALILMALWLTGCSGTIQRESTSGARRLEGATYQNVSVVLADEARKLQADNTQFSARELSDYVRRRLDATNLIRTDGRYRVEITIESFRVRSAAAAVLLGIMAGTDSIDGYIRVLDASGKSVHGYKINASYGLGGLAGGQDGMRMNWLYDKFSELTVAELAGNTSATNVAKGRASPSAPILITPSPGSDGTQMASAVSAPSTAPKVSKVATAWTPNAELRAAHPTTQFAKLEDVEAVPSISSTCRDRYQTWLTRSNPKAFAVGPKGHCGFSWGTQPTDPALPKDPAERALLACARAGNGDCKLYAIDNAVVWSVDSAQ